MSREQTSNENLQELTDAEICAVIRYLDSEVSAESESENNQALLVICISILIVLLGCTALVWLYSHVLG